MEALLLEAAGPSKGNRACYSVEDLQAQLREHLANSSSPTRAAHVSLRFEIPYNATLYIATEVETGAADRVPAPPTTNTPAVREVLASDTIINQPSDDPALQKAVSKHVIGVISLVDGVSWTVRSVARGAQGWTFVYICKDSLQSWHRANAKHPLRPPIAAFSGLGGLDPGNAGMFFLIVVFQRPLQPRGADPLDSSTGF